MMKIASSSDPNKSNISGKDTITRLIGIFENSRDVLYSLDYEKFVFDYISPSALEITGYTVEELMAMNQTQLLQIIHTEDREKYQKHWRAMTETNIRKSQTIEYRIKPKRGITKWLSDKHQLIFDDNNHLVKLVGNIRDITDIKLVEDALQRSRDRLSMAMEATNDGMWDWKLDTNEVYFDVRFYTMLGYEPFEFPGAFSEWMKRIHPDDVKHVRNQLNKYLEGKSDQWLIEYRFLAKNQNWTWVMNRGKVFDRDYDGKPLRMIGTHSDITQRKKTELTLKQKNDELLAADKKLKLVNQKLTDLNDELKVRNNELQAIYNQLQVSEEKFRQLAENTLDVFWLRDMQHVLYINPQFEKIWGRKREEVYVNPYILYEWIHPEDRTSFNTWVDFKNFLDGQPYTETYRILKPDGEVRWIWSRIIPVYQDDKIYRIVGVATDVTEQKLTEDALIETREKALESERLKSAFLANISHEIRTPMNGIIGFSDLLRGETLSDESRMQYINIISKSSEQLLHIINDIVDISKIESNQVQLSLTEVSLPALFSELFLLYQNEKNNQGKSHIALSIDACANVVVYTDESRLRQILMNLISNAFKFTKEGSVSFGYKKNNQQMVEFFVQDTGIGIPPELQSVVFKRFHQLENDITRSFGGTGLGLSICEGLVKLLGGKIWLKSEKHKGSTFYFTMPLSDKEKQPAKTLPFSSDVYIWKGNTILVVEDDYINQEFLNTVLTPTQANVLIASSGEEALQFTKQNPEISIVLMDLRLPQMSGYDAYLEIKKMRPNVPVIAQTAFALTEDSTHCLEMGFSGFVSKPINRKQLLILIDSYLRKNQ